MLKFWSRYKREYSACLRLAMPVILSQLGLIVVQFADTMMVGHLGATPLAAVAFGGFVYFVVFVFGTGVTLALTPLVGEWYARGNRRIVASYLQNAILTYTLLSLLLCGVMFAIVPFMHNFGQPEKVVDMALPYYKMMSLSSVPVMIYSAFKQFLEGIGNTVVSMVIIIATNLLNILLNWVFIYGNCGFEAMGATGAGLATLISRAVTPIAIILFFVLNSTTKSYLRLFTIKRFSLHRCSKLMVVGAPIGGQVTLECGAFVLSGIMMGWLGTVELAANQIALNIAPRI